MMGTTMRRAATIMALATGTATLTTPAQAAGHEGSAAALTRAGVTTTKGRAPRAGQGGFTIVGSLRNPVVAMTSPARGAVWLAERAKDGSLVVAEVGGRRWTAQTLPVTINSWDTIHLSGSARNDLWLTAAGQLWHYDGRRWVRTTLPAGTRAETVHDVAGKDVYVGLTGDLDSTGIFRLRGGRWNPLGRPASTDEAYGPEWYPRDITMANGTLFATFEARAHSAHVSQSSFSFEGGTWRHTMSTLDYGGGNTFSLGAWLVPDKSHQVAFTSLWPGTSDPLPKAGYCEARVRRVEATPCTTRWSVGSAALLRDGRIVVGGNDYQRYDKPVVQGTFGIRTKDGVEKLLGGDPGDKTQGMAVEPGTDTAWAATLRGSEVLLQKWVG